LPLRPRARHKSRPRDPSRSPHQHQPCGSIRRIFHSVKSHAIAAFHEFIGDRVGVADNEIRGPTLRAEELPVRHRTILPPTGVGRCGPCTIQCTILDQIGGFSTEILRYPGVHEGFGFCNLQILLSKTETDHNPPTLVRWTFTMIALAFALRPESARPGRSVARRMPSRRAARNRDAVQRG